MRLLASSLSDIDLGGLVERTGWMLLHSVWQFAFLALLLVVLERVLAKRSSTARYVTASIALCLMVASSVATYALVDVAEADEQPTGAAQQKNAKNVPAVHFNGYALESQRLHAIYVDNKRMTPEEWDEYPEPSTAHEAGHASNGSASIVNSNESSNHSGDGKA